MGCTTLIRRLQHGLRFFRGEGPGCYSTSARRRVATVELDLHLESWNATFECFYYAYYRDAV